MAEKRYEVVGTDEFFLHIEDTTLKEDKHEGAIYNIYQVTDRLNEQDELIGEITKSLLYCIDNERSYGDEYTAEVLNDIVEQFKLRERI